MAKSAILFSLLMICLAVKRHEFKTCKDLGFCQRSRLLARQSSLKVQYSVLESSISDSPTGVQFYLRSEANPSFHLKTRISHLENNILSVQIEEEAASRKRYSDQSDLVFNKTALRYLPNVKKLQNGLEWSQGQFKYVLSFKPFNIQGFVQDVLVYVVNDRNLLNFERTRNKDESCVKKDEFIQDSTCLDGDFQLWEEKWSSFVDPNVFGPSSVGIDVTWVNTENVYGIPEHADSLALRDTENDEPYRLYNLDVFEYELNERMALYGSVPFMISKQGGFFWNNPSETWVDIGSSSSKLGWLTGDSKPSKRTHWFSETGVIELYLFLGLTPIDLVQKFTIFTGPALFPPMFAISYHQCRWNYYTQKELLEVEQGFEDHNLPVDVLWLDIEHTPHRQYFLWDYSSFPSPKDMLNHLASHGRKLVNIVDPHMSKRSGYHVNKIFENKDLYVKNVDGNNYEAHCWPGTSSWPDYLKAEARNVWAEQFSLENYKDSALNLFIWNDMNEPAVFGGPENTMPKNNLHLNGVEHREIHNLYGMMMHRATFEGLIKRNSQDRPFVLSRAFYAGSQRYGAIWTGDNMAKWEHMEASVPMCLAVTIGGISFCGADLGGFFFNPSAELVERWYQIAAFSPFFRSHAHIETAKREPWVFGTETLNIAREALRERYRILPYLYTLFYEYAEKGLPIMRALFMEFPDDKAVDKLDKGYMLGDSLLVFVINSAQQQTMQVYLPQGRWFDFHTLSESQNTGFFNYQLQRNFIPVFIRGGSALFTQDRPRRSSSLMKNDPYSITLALDYDGRASGRVFIDDQKTFKYQAGEFLTGKVEFADNKLQFLVTHQWNLENVVEKVTVLGFKKIPVGIVAESGCGKEKVGFYVDGMVVTVKLGKMKMNENWTLTFIYE